MRRRMYALDYGDLRMARGEYSMIARNAAACLSRNALPCPDACPHGLKIDSRSPLRHTVFCQEPISSMATGRSASGAAVSVAQTQGAPGSQDRSSFRSRKTEIDEWKGREKRLR
jgi:hypothetical protein